MRGPAGRPISPETPPATRRGRTGGKALAPERRTLRLDFASAEAFEAEYAANLLRGGVFVATAEPFELRERVEVVLRLDFCDAEFAFEGEVVHRVSPELAAAGATAGVAVQLAGTTAEIRERLEPLARAAGAALPEPPELGRRRAHRADARVAARIAASDETLEGRTRNLSTTGVLVDVDGSEIAVGERVRLTLEHPTSGEALQVEGTVAREVADEVGVSAVAVRFDPPVERREEVDGFVDSLQSAEHTRRLGGITGAISALGPGNLISMLGSSTDAGTLLMRRREQDAVLEFENGLLRRVRLGSMGGLKALVRILGWREGRFEFHAHLDPLSASESPQSLDGALLEALRLVDEAARIDRRRLPDEAVPRVSDGEVPPGEDAKLEAAVLELAAAGFSIGRILDVIPEPDPEILRALQALEERGAIDLPPH